MTIGERIKQFRKRKKLTQKELAEKANIAVGTLQQYEAGTRIPKSNNLKNVAAVLGVTADEILSGKSEFESVRQKLEFGLNINLNDLSVYFNEGGNRLSKKEKDAITAFIRFLLSERKERE